MTATATAPKTTKATERLLARRETALDAWRDAYADVETTDGAFTFDEATKTAVPTTLGKRLVAKRDKAGDKLRAINAQLVADGYSLPGSFDGAINPPDLAAAADAEIADAPNLTDATERLEAALEAGIPASELLAAQAERLGSVPASSDVAQATIAASTGKPAGSRRRTATANALLRGAEPAPRSTKDAAELVLREAAGPMHIAAIAAAIIDRHLAPGLKGKTPAATIGAQIVTDAKRGGRFVRTDTATFDLREVNPRGAKQRPAAKS